MVANGHAHARRVLRPGIAAPMPTFFKGENEDLDVEAFTKHVVRIAEAGVGIVVAGSMGEAHHLSSAERSTLIRAAREALDAAGLNDVPIIAGTGLAGTRVTIELTREAAAAGADYAIVISAGYFVGALDKTAQRQLFTDVADASPIPVLIYNYPGATGGLDLESDVISDLAQHPNICGVKLTCGNVGKLTRIAAAVSSPGFAERYPRKNELVPGETPFLVFGGFMDFLVPSLAARAHGAIAGLANVAPYSIVRTYELAAKAFAEPAKGAQYLAEAQELQGIIADADRTIALAGIPGTKFLLEKLHQYGGAPRKPILRLSQKTEETLWAHPHTVALVELEQRLAKKPLPNGA